MSDHSTRSGGSSGLVVDRRQLMAGAAALGIGYGFADGPAFADDAPKKGGTLRLGMEGGSASDSLDPRTYADSIPISYGWQICNGLVEIDEKGDPTGELAESFEAQPGATTWVFNLRKDVTFSNGKTLDADDVIYSINLHRGETKSGAKDLLSGIKDIKKLGPNQIEFTLNSGDAGFPNVFADYHIIVVPNDFKDFSTLVGTGAYTLDKFEPGVRVVTKARTGGYWKKGRGNFEGVELRYIPDAAARTQALISGQIDAANRLDPKTAALVMKAPSVNVVRTKGTGNRFAFVALTDTDPYTSNDVRLALKYGIDRQKIVDTVFKGFATVGNDTTVSPAQKFWAKDIPQRPYDPDKAAFYFKKAAASAKIELQVSEGAFSGATDSAVLYQESAKKGGVDIDVKRVSGDGYWDNVWLKQPFCAVYWGGRPTIDNQLSQTFLSTANWNDTRWKRPEFDKLILTARAELDEGKRAQLYADAQRMIVDDGGMVCFAIGDYLDGYGKKVMGVAPHPHYDMCDQRVAEKGWFA